MAASDGLPSHRCAAGSTSWNRFSESSPGLRSTFPSLSLRDGAKQSYVMFLPDMPKVKLLRRTLRLRDRRSLSLRSARALTCPCVFSRGRNDGSGAFGEIVFYLSFARKSSTRGWNSSAFD
jgi:hypothetical protein